MDIEDLADFYLDLKKRKVFKPFAQALTKDTDFAWALETRNGPCGAMAVKAVAMKVYGKCPPQALAKTLEKIGVEL